MGDSEAWLELHAEEIVALGFQSQRAVGKLGCECPALPACPARPARRTVTPPPRLRLPQRAHPSAALLRLMLSGAPSTR